MASPKTAQWQEAMEAEIKSIDKNNTWSLERKVATLPNGTKMNVIKGRWLFKIKRDKDGHLNRYRARWVVKGYTQIAGVDYDETYASVAKPVTVRTFMALIASEDLECQQYDIVTAFLHSLIKNHRIYVEQPHGFEETDEQGAELVCLLLKALYGLKQSPLLWYEELTTFLKDIGFSSIWSDACLFRNNEGVMINIYVDDLLIAAATLEAIEHTAQSLAGKFELQSLGDVAFYLGCRIVRDRLNRKVAMVQDAYITQMLEDYHLLHGSEADTPFDPYHKLELPPEGYVATKNLRERYQSLVGKEMWPAQQTRPELSFAMTQLTRHLHNPMESHLLQADRVARYLMGTRYYGITFTGSTTTQELWLKGYADASYADDSESRRSTAGFVFLFGGAPIAWKAGRLPLVTLSSTESEYCVLTLCAKEGIAISRLLTDLHYCGNVKPVPLFEDSKPAIDLTKKPAGSDSRTKHIDVRWHYIRQAINEGAVTVRWISTEQQVADGLTKPLAVAKFKTFRRALGVVDCKAAIDGSS